MAEEFDPAEVKQACESYVKKKGALTFGLANLETLERISPLGCGPSAMLPKVKSVLCVGVGGGTRGAWSADAKTLAYIGDTETMAYRVAYGLAFFSRLSLVTAQSLCHRIWTRKKVPGYPCKA